MDVTFFNPWAEIQRGNNRLPHWEQPGATYFITFRLADSIPSHLFEQWNKERDEWLESNPKPWRTETEQEFHNRFSRPLEQWLDEGYGACLLRSPQIRDGVHSVFQRFDGERYVHHAWVIMPNHVHLVVSLKLEETLGNLLKSWKGASSIAVGQIIQQSMSVNSFWQKDYFDRMVRDQSHFWRCVRYVRNNPIKANLRADEFTLHLSPNVKSILDSPIT